MENLKKIREIKKLTQLQLAVQIGVSQEIINKYEKGIAKPSVKNLEKLADYFNCSTDYLLDRTSYRYSIHNLYNMCNLKEDEKAFLDDFNNLSQISKDKIKTMLKFVISEEEENLYKTK